LQEFQDESQENEDNQSGARGKTNALSESEPCRLGIPGRRIVNDF